VFLLQTEFVMRNIQGVGSQTSARQDRGLASTANQSLPLNALVNLEPSAEPTIMSNRTPTIFCWMLVTPETYEVDLLHLQLSKRSLSGCDGFAVYSNVTISMLLGSSALGTGFNMLLGSSNGKAWTGAMHFDTEPWSGYSKNRPIFTEVWRQVFADGHYRLYDWTVKLDADAILIPEKLRSILHHRHPFPGAAFLIAYNKMHGSLEVLSRGAMEAYAENPGACETNVASPREDEYLEACLVMLNVSRIIEPDILEDKAGYGHGSGSLSAEKLWPCNTSKAAVHPVKDPALWPTCFDACAGNHRTGI